MTTLTISKVQQNGTGATNRLITDKLNDFVSVTDFGADPSGLTDSTTAIRNAIASVPSSGGVLYFPRGEYLFSSTLELPYRIDIRGEGYTESNNVVSGTRLKKSASLNGTGIWVKNGSTSIRDLTVQGVTGNGGDGIVFTGTRCSLFNVAVFNMGGNGIRGGSDTTGFNSNLFYLENVRSRNNGGHGVYLHDKPYGTAPDVCGGTIINTECAANGGAGIYLGNANLNSILGGSTQVNGINGVHIKGSNNSLFGIDYEEGNVGKNLYIDTGATSNRIFGGVISLAGLTDNGTNTAIFGNTVKLANVNNTDPKWLDWYEEGTWTPSLTFSTPGDLAVTYSTRDGQYQRVGNTVHLSFSIVTSAFTHTTASGPMRVTGLPFAMVSATGRFATGSLQYAGITSATTPVITPRIDSAGSLVGFFGSGSGVANINITTTQVPTGGAIILLANITYQVA